MSIALERIKILFEMAEKKASKEEMELADRYVELARKIGMKAEEGIPQENRRSFCRECNSLLKPGLNCTVRINSKRKEILHTCENCENTERYGFKE